MSELRVSPEELMQYANDVAKKAEDLSVLVKSLDDKIEVVKANFDGMAANAFYNSYVTMRETLQQFPAAVEGIAKQAQNAAAIYDETDTQLAQALQG